MKDYATKTGVGAQAGVCSLASRTKKKGEIVRTDVKGVIVT